MNHVQIFIYEAHMANAESSFLYLCFGAATGPTHTFFNVCIDKVTKSSLNK